MIIDDIKKPCEQCGFTMQFCSASRRFCLSCSKIRAQQANKRNSSSYQRLAREYVSAAIKKGDLISLKTQVVQCSDCDARAEQYDHRDYARPLEVSAVCRSCNMRRGPGINDGKASSKKESA
jgi:hypothetical protein